jgi:hypothetical protein
MPAIQSAYHSDHFVFRVLCRPTTFEKGSKSQKGEHVMSEFVLAPHEGKSVWLGGIGVDFKIAQETKGAIAYVSQ